jgi:ABC-type nitrate/sulfonate/bicarbonate transport system permease component
MTSAALKTADPRATRPVSRRARGAAPSTLARVAQSSWLVVVAALAWWFLSAKSSNFFIPPLADIMASLGKDLGNGVIAAGAAYFLGILLGEARWLREVIDPIIHFFRSIPQAALVPLIIGTFGVGQGPKVGTIAFACVWPVLLNTIDGVLGVEPTVRKFARVYRIPPALYFRRVVLPAALPQIMAGIRVALPIGITVMVVSEMFASTEGLGFYILNSSATFQVPQTWAGALLVGVVGYVLSMLFVLVERRMLRWYHASGAQ